MRPRILIVAGGDKANKPKFHAKRSYLTAIENAGGEPFIIGRPKKENLSELFSLFRGVLLIGGDDIDPSFYGEENRHSKDIDRERDDIEISLIRESLERGIPLLGICRGFQVINVALGGTLYQDLPTEMPGSLRHGRVSSDDDVATHPVRIGKGTFLSSMTEDEEHMVNSVHHQGVKKIGEKLVASAHSPDGLIEAFEHHDHPFLLGIEWHPEDLADELSRRTFRAFIHASSGVALEKQISDPQEVDLSNTEKSVIKSA